MNFVFFGVKKSGISVFLVSVENGAGVNKMTNITYGMMMTHVSCGVTDPKGVKGEVNARVQLPKAA